MFVRQSSVFTLMLCELRLMSLTSASIRHPKMHSSSSKVIIHTLDFIFWVRLIFFTRYSSSTSFSSSLSCFSSLHLILILHLLHFFLHLLLFFLISPPPPPPLPAPPIPPSLYPILPPPDNFLPLRLSHYIKR